MATERELALVEAALKAAADEAESVAEEYRCDAVISKAEGAEHAADAICSLDPAAIVASVPKAQQQDESEALSMAVIEHIGPAALVGDKISILDAFELGWKARADLSAQEQVERTNTLRKLIADDAYAMTFQSLAQYRRALLSANQGK